MKHKASREGIKIGENMGSVAVGGVVLAGDLALIAKKSHGPLQGFWMIPGGGVKPGETLDLAVQREVQEETGVNASVRGIIAVRSCVLEDGRSDTHVTFLLDSISGEIRPDGREITEVKMVTLEEAQQITPMTEMSRYLIVLALEKKMQLLCPSDFLPFDFPEVAKSRYILFA
ncbi:MAG: NUDIX domain-containing protein [Firmicutes bacterium]|nr:NUDIX domain-containing protein [Bacillota bacterium]